MIAPAGSSRIISPMRTLPIIIVLIVVIAGVVWYQSRPAQAPTVSVSPGAVPAASEPKTVSIISFSFVPATITVKKGDKVTFMNNDTAPHTATAAGKFDTGVLQKGQSYLLDTAALAAGTYSYLCTLHPSMRGTLIVQ